MVAVSKRISWLRLAQAVEFYESIGYTYIEVPWVVDPVVTELTYHKPVRWTTEYGDLVGSAESGFLALSVDNPSGIKENKKYVSISPCFREDSWSKTHQPWFMKVELFILYPQNSFEDLITDAQSMFETIYDVKPTRKFIGPETDLQINGIEVGSYSSQSWKELVWACGTGLAEPRTSIAIEAGTNGFSV